MSKLLLFMGLAMASRAVSAQAARPWPRNPATNRIEFAGHLAWPDTVRTEAQRQVIVRRWYRRKLTNDTPTMIRRIIRESGTTYSGIPSESCYRLSIMNRDEEHYSLCFQLNLTAADTGLTYKIFDFESGYGSFDYGTNGQLESVLTLDNAMTQSVIKSFHELLLEAIKSW